MILWDSNSIYVAICHVMHNLAVKLWMWPAWNQSLFLQQVSSLSLCLLWLRVYGKRERNYFYSNMSEVFWSTQNVWYTLPCYSSIQYAFLCVVVPSLMNSLWPPFSPSAGLMNVGQFNQHNSHSQLHLSTSWQSLLLYTADMQWDYFYLLS